MIELNRIYNESNCDTMRRMSDGFVDLILTDPPYGIGLEYDIYKDTEENWYKLFDEIMPEFKRVAKMIIMPSCRIEALEWIYKNHPPDWLICWYKGSPGHRSYVGFNDWEPLLVYGKNEGVQMHDYLSINNTEKMGDNGHPCPKPVKWAQWLIQRASKEGNLIYDPFMGSGTVGVAAAKLNRNYVGSEISPDYCQIAERRIKTITDQFTMFNEAI